MDRRLLEINRIFVLPERIRNIRAHWVEAFADSMQARGQLQPILVKPEGERFKLLVGEHRFEAAKRLGWTRIECSVGDKDMTAGEEELFEIDENLFRNELSAIERDVSLARRKELYEKANPETVHGGDRKSVRRTKSSRQNVDLIRFSRDAAKKTGLNERTIQRSVARIRALPPEMVAALKNSPVGDNASEIERLSKLPQAQQIKVAGAIERGAKALLAALKSVGLAPEPPDQTALHFGKIVSAWAKAPKASRAQFLDKYAPGWRGLEISIENEDEGEDA